MTLGHPWNLTDADVDASIEGGQDAGAAEWSPSAGAPEPAGYVPESGGESFSDPLPLPTFAQQQPPAPDRPAPATAGSMAGPAQSVGPHLNTPVQQSRPAAQAVQLRGGGDRDSSPRVGEKPDRMVPDSKLLRNQEQGVQGLFRRIGRRWERELPAEQVVMNLQKSLPKPKIVAVVNHAGGVGKSECAGAMGQQMATHRRDRVIVVDAAVSVGGISRRLPVTNESTISTFLSNLGSINKWSDARQHTSQGRTGLELLASGSSMADDDLLTADGYRSVIDTLTAHDAYNLIIIDCDAGVTGPLMDAVFDSADALVVPLSGHDGVAGAVATMNRLMVLADRYPSRRTHYESLVFNAVVAINHVAPKSALKDAEVAAHFKDRVGVREVVTIPFDHALKDGAHIDLVQMSKSTSTAFLRLAAGVITSLRRGPA